MSNPSPWIWECGATLDECCWDGKEAPGTAFDAAGMVVVVDAFMVVFQIRLPYHQVTSSCATWGSMRHCELANADGPHLWFNLKIFGIVLFESANKFGQLCWNYEILEPITTLTNVAHPTYLVITYGPNKKTCSQCNMSTIFTQFCLQLLHQYIDCVVTITNASPKALRYGAVLDMES